jgi:hypothetical protein
VGDQPPKIGGLASSELRLLVTAGRRCVALNWQFCSGSQHGIRNYSATLTTLGFCASFSAAQSKLIVSTTSHRKGMLLSCDHAQSISVIGFAQRAFDSSPRSSAALI